MGEITAIEWTDHTFNPWWGCEKISPGCRECYAATLAARFGTAWGAEVPRRFFGDKHWNEPLAWNRAAEREGRVARVFCASMADVFEDRRDLDDSRTRLYALMRQTPSLEWLLLTKRPEKIRPLTPSSWWIRREDRPRVRFGITAENQEMLDARLPHLPSGGFLSCEPLLGPLDLSRALGRCSTCKTGWRGWSGPWDPTAPRALCPSCNGYPEQPHVSWVIAGGESSSNARPMRPEWARSIRDQCAEAGVPFFFKQWGEWAPGSVATAHVVADHDVDRMYRVGKKAAGSILDGCQHREFPKVRS